MSYLAALLLMLVPHTALKRSEPAKDAVLSAAPTRISLWFTAEAQRAFSRIRLQGPSGDVPLDTIAADTGHSLHARIPAALGPGTYKVVWQTAGADGHPIRGEFGFTVLGAAPDTTLARGDTLVAPVVPPRSPDVEVPQANEMVVSEFRAVRWFEFAALLTVLGAIGFRHAVLPPLAVRGVPTTDAADRARRIGRIALAVYIIAAFGRLYAAAAALKVKAFGPMLTYTSWGRGWAAGVIGAGLLAVAWSLPRRVAGSIGTPLALTGALAMVLSPALSGHTFASELFVLSMTVDMLHVAAAGLWIGGVLMVILVGVPAMHALPDGNRDAAVRALVSSFHPLALFCAPLVVVAGAGLAWIRLGSFAGLQSVYGAALLWKVGLALCVAGMGAYNAWRARKRLGAPEGTRHFIRTGTAELVFAALVLAATTVLVVSPLPTDITP